MFSVFVTRAAAAPDEGGVREGVTARCVPRQTFSLREGVQWDRVVGPHQCWVGEFRPPRSP